MLDRGYQAGDILFGELDSQLEVSERVDERRECPYTESEATFSM